MIIGFGWLFGQGLQFAGLTLGTAVLGSYVGIQLFNRQKQKEKDCNIVFHTGSCRSPCPDPDDDNNNNERKFNTISKTEFFKSMKKHYEYYKILSLNSKLKVFFYKRYSL